MDKQLADRLPIRDVIQTWAIARDSGDWETFRGTWHDDGYVMATWFQGPAGKFIEVSRDGRERGVSILHFLGGGRITVPGKRAIAQTRMTIMQCGAVNDVLCDVTCTGRFYDFLERRAGRWAIVLRQPIYEKDRIDPVDPAAAFTPRPISPGSLPRGIPAPRVPADTTRFRGQARQGSYRGSGFRTAGSPWEIRSTTISATCSR